MMIEISDRSTIPEVLAAAAERFGAQPLLAVPPNPKRGYLPQGHEISVSEVATLAKEVARQYRAAGYGYSHRIGLYLANRPEHIIHKLALNSVGACCVPINPDYRVSEIAYLIEHSRADLIVVLDAEQQKVDEAVASCSHRAKVITLEQFGDALPGPEHRARIVRPTAETPASILYTSGTTGHPKGCVLSHRYELAAGAWYAQQGGMVSIKTSQERLYNPLPLFHVNSSVLSFFCMLMTGNCQIQTDRFQVSRWWEEVRVSRATIVHYLGVIVPLLLKQPESPQDLNHDVRLGYGAGVEPELHRVFEDRFGFPLVEIWGMTEMVRVLNDNHPPRKVGTRAFGKAQPGLEVQVVDQNDCVVPDGTPGEMVIRHSLATPRKDFFSEYLDDVEATEHAWRNGWFHTGDVVVRGQDDGMLHFVDRDKNIIRRSGENIAAAEVEAQLLAHPDVQQVAVIPAPDEIRETEVFACIVLKCPDKPGDVLDPATLSDSERQAYAKHCFQWCNERLAYYKAPGWIWFTKELPTTGTQKIQKHRIISEDSDPRTELLGVIDMRENKRRITQPPNAVISRHVDVGA